MKPAEIIKPGYFQHETDKKRDEFDYHNESIVTHGAPVDLLFIGDSITHLWEVEDYFLKFGRVVNRGICGDLVELLHRRFAADVIQLKPRLAVVMVGVNNTWGMCSTEAAQLEQVEDETCAFILGEYRGILEDAKAAGLELLVCSLTPVDCGLPQNRLIQHVNRELKPLAESYGYAFVDYHPHLAREDGCTLREDLSWDRLHPHVLGFDIMARVLLPFLEERLETE